MSPKQAGYLLLLLGSAIVICYVIVVIYALIFISIFGDWQAGFLVLGCYILGSVPTDIRQYINDLKLIEIWEAGDDDEQ